MDRREDCFMSRVKTFETIINSCTSTHCQTIVIVFKHKLYNVHQACLSHTMCVDHVYWQTVSITEVCACFWPLIVADVVVIMFLVKLRNAILFSW